MRARDGAGSIAEHLVTTFQLCGRWPPATRQPVLEQLGRAGPMIPYGDRRDGAESGGVEGQELAGVQRKHDIMVVLILCHNLSHLTRRYAAASPRKDVGQGEKFGQLG